MFVMRFMLIPFVLFIVQYIDVDFTLWLSWLLTPLVITFLLPLVIVFLLYVNVVILYVYKLHWATLRASYRTGDKWAAARKTISAIWDAHGWIWHGTFLVIRVNF